MDEYDRRFDSGSSGIQPRIIIDHHTDSDSIFRSFNLSGKNEQDSQAWVESVVGGIKKNKYNDYKVYKISLYL